MPSAQKDWTIPPTLRPDPKTLAFDLDAAVANVVALHARVPEDAFTAGILGTERDGSGVLIAPHGVVLTIGYIVTEAEQVWITGADGQVAAGHVLGIDATSGLALVQPLGRFSAPGLMLGDSDALVRGSPAVMVAGGGPHRAVATKVAARQEFAGYWEYLIPGAILTAPAHPAWGGAALLGPDGRVHGIGSLILQAGGKRRGGDMNMAVPAGLLAMEALRTTGRGAEPPRPWLGLYATEDEDGVTVVGVADNGPADRAGLREGDRLLAIQGQKIGDLASAWRAAWSAGPAGARVALRISRDGREHEVDVASVDRASMLRAPRLH
jgi:S1-C subfamily serine protease